MNFKSDRFNVPSGVNQKDHLSTLLFNIFTNDIPNVIKNSHVFLFADDLMFVKIFNNQGDAVDLQTDINSIQSWCSASGLSLNIGQLQINAFLFNENVNQL